MRFGIAHELYAYEQNWVQMDGDGRNAKPLEDPGAVYARRFGPTNGASLNGEIAFTAHDGRPEIAVLEPSEIPPCPKCGGRMWDNRLSKRNPKAPDYKCRDRSCDGVIWPARSGITSESRETVAATRVADAAPRSEAIDSAPLGLSLDDIPF